MPEVAFLIEVDGLTIYNTGHYTGRLDTYKDDINYLSAKIKENVDLAFVFLVGQSQNYAINKFNPEAVFVQHAPSILLEGGAGAFRKRNPGINVFIPEYKGDRFVYANRKVERK